MFSAVLIFFFFITHVVAQSEDNEELGEYSQRFEHARSVFHSAYFEQASILFDHLLKEKPDHALLHAYMAFNNMMLYKDAGDHVEQAQSLSKPADDDHAIALALCEYVNGDLEACTVKIGEYLDKNPESDYGQHILGFTLTDLGKPEEGRNVLQKLIDNSPAYYQAYNHLGYSYLGLQENEKAKEAFDQFVKANPKNPSAYDSYAEALSALGKHDEAIASLTRALLLEPNFAYGWKHMGDILSQSEEKTLAIHAYTMAIKSSELYGDSFRKSMEKKIEKLK